MSNKKETCEKAEQKVTYKYSGRASIVRQNSASMMSTAQGCYMNQVRLGACGTRALCMGSQVRIVMDGFLRGASKQGMRFCSTQVGQTNEGCRVLYRDLQAMSRSNLSNPNVSHMSPGLTALTSAELADLKTPPRESSRQAAWTPQGPVNASADLLYCIGVGIGRA